MRKREAFGSDLKQKKEKVDDARETIHEIHALLLQLNFHHMVVGDILDQYTYPGCTTCNGLHGLVLSCYIVYDIRY